MCVNSSLPWLRSSGARAVLGPIFTSFGIALRYLPARSPWLNPIEKCFGWMKRHLVGRVLEDGDVRPIALIYQTVDKLSVQLCASFIDYLWEPV
jgi:transposase